MCFLWLEHDHVCCKRKRSKLTSSQIIKRMRKWRRRFLKTEPAACILARSFCSSFAVRHAWMHVARVQTWKLWKISIVIQMTLPTWNIHIFHLCVTTFYVNDNVICVYIYILCIYLNIYIFMGSKVNRKTEANPCLVHIGRYRVETVHGFDLLNRICFSIPWNRKTRCFRKHHCKMHAELQPFRKRFLWTFS